MPIEIRELIIKTQIENQDKTESGNPDIQYQNIVSDCIEEVLRILKEKEER